MNPDATGGATGGATGQGGNITSSKIGPVNIEITQGSLMYEKTDAICCSIKGLGLTKGMPYMTEPMSLALQYMIGF